VVADQKEAVLRLLGLALRAGRLQLGSGPVLRALTHAPPGIVFLAKDAGRNVVRSVRRVEGASSVEDAFFDGEDLSRAFGRRQLSVVSVHDAGFVDGLKKLLSETR
jgi:ribosomal protein L7Ae-like RNA K-turn-binding protein